MSNRRQKTLILHHDEIALLDLEHTLETQGCDTTSTWDLREAVALLRAKPFELLVVAHHPPEIDAAVVLRAARGAPDLESIVLLPRLLHPFEQEHFAFLGASAVVTQWTALVFRSEQPSRGRPLWKSA